MITNAQREETAPLNPTQPGPVSPETVRYNPNTPSLIIELYSPPPDYNALFKRKLYRNFNSKFTLINSLLFLCANISIITINMYTQSAYFSYSPIVQALGKMPLYYATSAAFANIIYSFLAMLTSI
jgi:hypothetical protein